MEFMGQSEIRDQTFDFDVSFRTLRVQEPHQRRELLSFTNYFSPVLDKLFIKRFLFLLTPDKLCESPLNDLREF